METDLNTLSRMIEHWLLFPTLSDDALVAGCELAERHNVSSVCVSPSAVSLTADLLSWTSIAISTAVGYPYGHSKISLKVAEAEEACKDGAVEVEFAINGGKVFSRDWDYIFYEIGSIHEAVASYGAVSKVIFRNDFLEDTDTILRLCEMCNAHGVTSVKVTRESGYIKQRNGTYAYIGFYDHHLASMRKILSPQIHMEAAGGLRTLDDLLRVRALGVTRIGATATAKILAEACARGYTRSGSIV